jgi:hypothetical protein
MNILFKIVIHSCVKLEKGISGEIVSAGMPGS